MSTEVIFSTLKQAFGELRPGFEGVTQGCFNKDTYASACWRGSSTNRRRAKSGNRKEIFMRNKRSRKNHELTRRGFIKTSAVAGAVLASGTNRIFAAGSDELRIGLIGCGGRGTSAASQILTCTKRGVKLWAVGDVFGDQVKASLEMLHKGAEPRYDREAFPSLSDKMNVPRKRQFVGFDAYKEVIESGVDIVILACPPHFRARHFKAAVEAGKHVFMEKPVAADPAGVRSVIASAELAKRKGLSVVAGTQRRHQAHYIEIMRRIHNGEIGEIRAAQCCWAMGLLWVQKRKPGWSDMEWQIRNWLYFTWLSGDQPCEQHVHNLDIINWALGAHPVQCMGMGGREVRTGPEHGNIFDHFAVEYEYPNGVRVTSMCRQMAGCTERVSERVVGTNGSTYTDQSVGFIEGRNAYKYDGPAPDPYVQEHADLIKSIREGRPVNEGKQVAESTLTAIMGRMSAYTGRALKWDWVMKASKLDLTPPRYEFGDLPVAPVSVPGKTPLI